MCATRDTTLRDQESIAGVARPRMWLRWVFPSSSAVCLDHGLSIGRDEDCKVRLDGAGVSRRHAEIHRQGPVFALKDLGSTNGTFLDGKRVQHAAVVPGSVLRVGEHVGIFVEAPEAPADFRQLASGLFGGDEVQRALEAVRRAAKSTLPILLVGATGSGKERVARAVHEFSARTGAFHALNCAALPKDLAEAELFGYRKGAFTGAERAGLGHFRAADGGTLFLDEVTELPLALQAKLLRVLEEQVVTPLGDTEGVPIDVRIVAAAQRPLSEAVAQRAFREDLLSRLAGLTVQLPKLCERAADIAPLFQYFVHHYSGGRPPRIEAKLIEALCLHEWPRNVRELEHVARQVLAVNGLEPTLKRSLLPRELLDTLPLTTDSALPPVAAEPMERRDHDMSRLAEALQQTQGSVAQSAALLGISRQRVYRLLGGDSPTAYVDRHLSQRLVSPKGERA